MCEEGKGALSECNSSKVAVFDADAPACGVVVSEEGKGAHSDCNSSKVAEFLYVHAVVHEQT